MSHTVQCLECEPPKVWHWLCQLCAEECQVAHRRESGHGTHLTVVGDDELTDPRSLR